MSAIPKKTWGALALLSFVSSLAEAKVDRVLHEPIPEDLYRSAPQESSQRNAALAAAGGGGQAGAPSRPGAPGGSNPAGKNPTSSSGSDEFAIDRDTRRPDVLPYSDPFEPSVAPFKRLHAYDTVADSYLLSESADPRHDVAPGPASPNDVLFNAKLTLTVESGVPVRLPTPGPGSKLVALAVTTDKGKPIEVVVRSDPADNWDLETTTSGAVVVSMRIAVSADAFGGDFGDPTWEALPQVAPLPQRAVNAAAQVTRSIGVSRTLPVRDAVKKLVAYFRSFQESNDPPPSSGDIYLDLSLSKKGVCRHRAFAFFVTARSLGIPTRVITNEAHAWVEVHNGIRWKRIDLGGAGGALEAGVQPPMTPPPDPFAWPDSADRGSDLASRATQPPSTGGGGAGNAAGTGAAAGGTATTTDAQSSGGPITTTPTTATGPNQPDDPREKTEVAVQAPIEPNAKRGGMLPVRGKVSTASGQACAHASVVISLREQHGRAPSIALGVVPAKEDGSFDSNVFVPRDLPPGDYEVLAQTPGDSRCSKSAAQ